MMLIEADKRGENNCMSNPPKDKDYVPKHIFNWYNEC